MTLRLRQLQGQVILARERFMLNAKEYTDNPNALTWDNVLASKVRLERAVRNVDEYNSGAKVAQ